MPGLSIPAVAWEVLLHSSQWLPRPFPPSLSIGSERAHAWHALSLTTKPLMVIWAAQALLLGVQCNPLRPGPTADHRSDEAGLPGCGGTKRPLFSKLSCSADEERVGNDRVVHAEEDPPQYAPAATHWCNVSRSQKGAQAGSFSGPCRVVQQCDPKPATSTSTSSVVGLCLQQAALCEAWFRTN